MNIKKVVTKNTLDFSIEDIEEINDAFYVYKDLSSEEIKKLYKSNIESSEDDSIECVHARYCKDCLKQILIKGLLLNHKLRLNDWSNTKFQFVLHCIDHCITLDLDN